MTTRGRSTALAGYVKYAPDDKRAVALRGEYFDQVSERGRDEATNGDELVFGQPKPGVLVMWGSAAWAQTQLTPGVSVLAAPRSSYRFVN